MKKNNRLRNGLFILLIICMIFPFTAHAEKKWLVLGNTDWVTGDDRLTLKMPSVLNPDLIVTSNSAGDLEWISMNIPFTLGSAIKGIYVCYKAPDEGTFISQIRLSEYLLPGTTVSIKHDDAADLISRTGDCYLSTVNHYTPQGSVNLSLRLNFANVDDRIEIGALGILIDP